MTLLLIGLSMNIFETTSCNENGCGTFQNKNVLTTLFVFLALSKTTQNLETHVAGLKTKICLLDALNHSSTLS